MDIEKMLEDYKSGNVNKEEMLNAIKKLPFSDIDIAKIDFHRNVRSGYAEVIYGEGKTLEQIHKIVEHIIDKSKQDILITRTNEEVYKSLKDTQGISFDKDAKVIFINRNNVALKDKGVLVMSAGTCDIGVCREAVLTLNAMGIAPKEIYDVGVCGLHRLLAHIDELQKARVIIVAAGMEGALASVVSGLVSAPIIAVPTSVGYGASFNGVSALLSMLTSCANRVCTVNIDNGFGAASVAAAIVNS